MVFISFFEILGLMSVVFRGLSSKRHIFMLLGLECRGQLLLRFVNGQEGWSLRFHREQTLGASIGLPGGGMVDWQPESKSKPKCQHH